MTTLVFQVFLALNFKKLKCLRTHALWNRSIPLTI